jgi:putative transposase
VPHLENRVGASSRLPDRDEARHDIFEFVEVFDNRQRSHSTLGYLSPAQFEVTALAA